MRRSVIFGRNDLVMDAPISRIDLLLCRNVLIYFIPEAQHRILDHFRYALNGSGRLFLGRSEMLIAHADLFAPENLKWRVFTKVARSDQRERARLGAAEVGSESEAARNVAASMSPVAQIVVDRGGYLEEANALARELFLIGAADLGRPFQDLAVSYRPADLRSGIDAAYEGRETVRIGRHEHVRPDGESLIFEIEVAPVIGRLGELLGATVIFNDVTALARLAEDYIKSKHELDAAYEELQSTVEELETTNEELQTTNEELETTNEELQTTNEELESTNEELQSTNYELENLNNEVRERSQDMDRVNIILEGILGNLGMAMTIVDAGLKIQLWNDMAEELWNLSAVDVMGQDVLGLDIGMPVGSLKDELQKVVKGDEESVEAQLPARDGHGREFECTVRILPLTAGSDAVYGAMILTAPADRDLGKRD